MRGGFDYKLQGGAFWDDGNVLDLDCGNGYITMSSSRLNLTGYKLYFNKTHLNITVYDASFSHYEFS